MESNLFDLTDASDLPFKVTDERREDSLRSRLVEVLPQAGGPVSVKQIRAALYRKHGKNYMSNNISSVLCTLLTDELVKRVDVGV